MYTQPQNRWSHYILSLIAGVAFTAAAPLFAQPHTGDPEESFAPDGYELAWEDDFNGHQLDHDKWFYRNGIDRGRTVMSRDNVILDHGHLNLVVQSGDFRINRETYPYYNGERDTFNYVGAGVISDWRFSLGYYEARSKMLDAHYWHPAYWLEVVNADDDNNLLRFHNRAEIDIMECEPQWPVAQSIRVHDWLTGGEHRKLPPKDPKTKHNMTIASDQSLGWYVWGMELTEDQAIFFENGRHVVTVDIPDDYRRDPMNIILSCVTIKDPEDSGIQKFDWVRYHEPASLRESDRKECERLIQFTSLVGPDFMDERDTEASNGWRQRASNAKKGDFVTYRVYVNEPGEYAVKLRTFAEDDATGAWRLTIDGEKQGKPIRADKSTGYVEWELGTKAFAEKGYAEFTLTCVNAKGKGAVLDFDWIELVKE
ncbi:glycoside hydrolase family 16 protein [Algisphaera agarilytica]|uniref:GH16 domain-containing protein n=1 Tax=Algisphaera agarilytica TaxID=1385975 RepID=A0A7X0LLA4_9BACT|nr:hypothetical protein [Algisphaera agarilytica]MBB6429783.1 hypothetical protein [Algisphaera agarilytica]